MNLCNDAGCQSDALSREYESSRCLAIDNCASFYSLDSLRRTNMDGLKVVSTGLCVLTLLDRKSEMIISAPKNPCDKSIINCFGFVLFTHPVIEVVSAKKQEASNKYFPFFTREMLQFSQGPFRTCLPRLRVKKTSLTRRQRKKGPNKKSLACSGME